MGITNVTISHQAGGDDEHNKANARRQEREIGVIGNMKHLIYL